MGNTNSSSSSGEEQKLADADAGAYPVYLNVYEPKDPTQVINIPLFGIYHTGVQVHDVEYFFVGSMATTTGVEQQQPLFQAPESPWKFKEAVLLGYTNHERQDVETIVSSLKPEFIACTYHLTSKNCNHFSEALSTRLGLPFPNWVNRAAKVGDTFRSFLPTNAPASLASMSVASKSQASITSAAASTAIQAAPITVPITLPIAQPVTLQPVDLAPYLELSSCTCLNCTIDHPIQHALDPKYREDTTQFISSDTDPQLLIYLPFSRLVKLSSLIIHLSDKASSHPRTIHLFRNQSNLNFHHATSLTPTQTIILTMNSTNNTTTTTTTTTTASHTHKTTNTGGGNIYATLAAATATATATSAPTSHVSIPPGANFVDIALRASSFTGCSSLSLFIVDNHGSPHTKIQNITLMGHTS